MLERHILVAFLMHPGDDFIPQDTGLHHIALLGRGHFLAPGAGEVESDARNAVDLECVIDLRVDAALLAIAEIGDRLRLAEIDAARKFAHDQHVEPFDDVALEG